MKLVEACAAAAPTNCCCLAALCLQLWLGGRGGNANFLYGMNLVWGGLQVLLLLRLLRAAARAEATAAVGGGVVEGSGSAGKQRQD